MKSNGYPLFKRAINASLALAILSFAVPVLAEGNLSSASNAQAEPLSNSKADESLMNINGIKGDTEVSSKWIEAASKITQPYKASYDLDRRGRTYGTAERELSINAEGKWRYQTNTRASFLFLSDRRYNDSLFQMNGYYVEPLTYEYARRGTGSDEEYRVRFQRAEERLEALDGSEVSAEWRDHLLDANAVLHQLQIDVAIGEKKSFVYELIDEDGRNERYEFAITGEESLDVRGETMNVLRVERVRDHDRRQTYFWFAPSLNYTLVGMQQIEEDKEELRLVLTGLEFAEQR